MRTDPPEPWILRRRRQVGNRMRSLRLAAGISQERLAEILGVDRKTVNRIETGVTAMSIDQVAYVARALHAPPAWLFTDDWRPPGAAPGEGNDPSTGPHPGS